jgi:hypothetical protein
VEVAELAVAAVGAMAVLVQILAQQAAQQEVVVVLAVVVAAEDSAAYSMVHPD